MAKVITFSRFFPKGHPQEMRPTHFPEKVVKSLGYNPGSNEYWALLHELNPGKQFIVDRFILSLNSFLPEGQEKLHTIRAGNRWKQGDKASLRVWYGKPYRSPQIVIAPDVELVEVYDFEIAKNPFPIGPDVYHGVNSLYFELDQIAQNDGLSMEDFLAWFKYPQHFEGQILAWRPVNYV